MPVVSSLMTQNKPVAWATLTGTRRVVGGGSGCTACVVMELPFARGGAPSPDRRLQQRRAVGSHPSTKQGCRSARSSGVLPQQALATTPVGVPSGCTSLLGTMTAHPGAEQSRRHELPRAHAHPLSGVAGLSDRVQHLLDGLGYCGVSVPSPAEYGLPGRVRGRGRQPCRSPGLRRMTTCRVCWRAGGLAGWRAGGLAVRSVASAAGRRRPGRGSLVALTALGLSSVGKL